MCATEAREFPRQLMITANIYIISKRSYLLIKYLSTSNILDQPRSSLWSFRPDRMIVIQNKLSSAQIVWDVRKRGASRAKFSYLCHDSANRCCLRIAKVYIEAGKINPPHGRAACSYNDIVGTSASVIDSGMNQRCRWDLRANLRKLGEEFEIWAVHAMNTSSLDYL